MAKVKADVTNGPLPNASDARDALPNEGDGEGPAHENYTEDGNKQAETPEIEIPKKPAKKRKAKGAVVEPSGGSKPEKKKIEKQSEKKPEENNPGKKPAHGKKRKAEAEVPAEVEKKPEDSKAARGKGVVLKTFARRNRPSTKAGALKWDALHEVFFQRIKPAVVAHSAHQDWVGLVGFLGLGSVCQPYANHFFIGIGMNFICDFLEVACSNQILKNPKTF